MKTISSIVEEYIKTKPFLSSALSQGIINLTSLSRLIKPEIEHQLGKEVKNGAIVMALKRLSSELEFRVTHRVLKFVRNIGEITVRSSLNDYTFKVSETLLKSQAAFMSEIEGLNTVFYTSSRGVNESNIVVSNEVAELVGKIFKHEILLEKQENLSSITVKLPKDNVNVPGIYYFIFQRLSWEGVNIYEVISTTNEFTILVNDEQVDKAFTVIKNLKSL
ncbi:aspartate kinase [uncultured Kordia sp.]|uniref:aspartate kinase n=1 Tax=uncultured Kordia sp. TaxID=507699 RepID=UPI00262D4448|nr:aspartate kinase [uncultured Kordia sp.]